MRRWLALLFCLLIAGPAFGQSSGSRKQTARRAAPAQQTVKKPAASHPAKPPVKRVAPKRPKTAPPAAIVSLRGSRHSQRRQNLQADREDLTRLEGAANLARFKKAGLLARLPQNNYVRVDPRLGQRWRWARPWTNHFLRDRGLAHYRVFHRPIQVNSAVRTAERQRELGRHNGNAASVRGPTASSHLTGSTIDITKRGMSVAEIRWMRSELLKLERQGFIEVTEEFRQPVFHVMVFKRYDDHAKKPVPKTASQKSVASKKAPARKTNKKRSA